MKTSETGKAFIKEKEGFSSAPYKDVAGYWTAGWGHLLDQGRDWESVTFTTAQLNAFFNADIYEAENTVNNLVTVPLNQNQFDALVSFVFNLGHGNFVSSTLLRKLNAGDYDAAALEFPRWVYAKGEKINGLVTRREQEKSIFLS